MTALRFAVVAIMVAMSSFLHVDFVEINYVSLRRRSALMVLA